MEAPAADRRNPRWRREPVRSPAQQAALRRDAALQIALIVVAFTFGGASRGDALSQLFIRLAALAIGLAVLAVVTAERWRRCAPALWLLAAAAALMALQLLPLPASWWAALPGRAPYAAALALVGEGGRWRPISFTPDLTLNSLLALLPAASAAVTFGAPEERSSRLLLAVVLAGIATSAFVSLMQLSSGALYLYAITNQGAGVGVFANRNHQALLLATALPLLAAWSALGGGVNPARRFRALVATGCAALIFPFLLITGSRAGLIEGVLGAGLSALLLSPSSSRSGWTFWGVKLAPVAAGLAVVAAALMSGRDVALGRLLATGGGELRVENIPVYWRIIRTFAPFGTGFGSFDPIFRRYELDALLEPAYLNHAHNDLMEIAIEGGGFAMALFAVFIGWFARAARRAFRARPRSAEDVLGRAGAIAVILMLVGSLVDYPLRTPLLSVLFVLSCTWLRQAEQGRGATVGLAMKSPSVRADGGLL
jgi:hypothetical protein